jgi:hypothetical protein
MALQASSGIDHNIFLFLPCDDDMVQNLKITRGHVIKVHSEVLASNFGWDTDYHDCDFSTYSTFLPGKQRGNTPE